jgi:hypothetical protein
MRSLCNRRTNDSNRWRSFPAHFQTSKIPEVPPWVSGAQEAAPNEHRRQFLPHGKRGSEEFGSPDPLIFVSCTKASFAKNHPQSRLPLCVLSDLVAIAPILAEGGSGCSGQSAVVHWLQAQPLCFPRKLFPLLQL